MAVTTIADMRIVPQKFTAYTLQRTTEQSMLVRSGIAVGNPLLAQLINGTPQGGRFIEMPFYKPLTGTDDVFGETEVAVTGVETGAQTATLHIRQHAWGDTDLARVLGGSDPMAAVGNMLADWWVQREQAMMLSVMKGILDKAAGALKSHINDISAASGEASKISVAATLDTKQLLGDAAGSLGLVCMHSAVYTALQKNQQIATEYDATLQVNIQTYLGYQVVVDDGMPVTGGVYDTYFIGAGAFAREDGTPQGLVTVETDRDVLLAHNYLINRRAFVLHPLGLSWTATGNGVYTNTAHKYPANVDLEKPANWQLVVDHKLVPIACLRHKI